MARTLILITKHSCERCPRVAETTRDIERGKTFWADAPLIKGWGVIDGKMLCPSCTVEIKAALAPVSTLKPL